MSYFANARGSFYYSLKEILSLVMSFPFFMIPLFFDILIVFLDFLCTLFSYIRFVRQDFLCSSFLDLLLVFHDFYATFLFNFLYFLGICIFHITATFQDFVDTFLFYMQYKMFYFRHIFFFILFSSLSSCLLSIACLLFSGFSFFLKTQVSLLLC